MAVLLLTCVTGAVRPEAPRAEAAAPVSAEESASAKARATGEPVEVDALGTENVEVVANPEGDFTATAYDQPVRAHTATGWAPVDTTLVTRPDGTVGPKVAAVPVAFSGGGSAPLARTGAGEEVTGLDWAAPLPPPVLDGPTATYRDLLPGVDLALTATSTGFSESVVVRDPAAVRDPRLRELRFGLHGDGAPAATAVAAEEITPEPAAAGEQAWKSAGDTTAPARWDVTDDAVTLRLDEAQLSDPTTTYPLSVNGPDWGRNRHWVLLSHNPTTGAKAAYWDSSHLPRVGRARGDDTRWRSYFEMDSAWLAGKRVKTATFRIFEWWAESCQPQPVELWHIGAISPTTTWGDATPFHRKAAEVASAHGYDAGCEHQQIGFDIKDLMAEAAENRWPTTTLALKAREDATSYAAKEFLNRPVPELGLGSESNPLLSIAATYNTVPEAATDVTVANQPCTGADPVVVNTPTPEFAATVADADAGAGQQIRAVYRWWEGTGATPSDAASVAGSYSGPGRSKAVVPPEKALRHGTTYTLAAVADDKVDSSAGQALCRFTVDTARPGAPPAVSSAQFPPKPAPGPPVFTAGQLTFDAGGDPDVVSFEYGIGYISAVENRKVDADAPGGRATVAFTPDIPATSSFSSYVVSVKSVDRAGNRSAKSTTYQFMVGIATTAGTPYGNWKADSVSGGKLVDTKELAGQPRFDATISGAVTSTKDRANKLAGAVRLDGTAAHAVTSAPVAPRTPEGTFGSFTAAAWVKLDRPSEWAAVISQDGDLQSGFALKYNSYPRSWQFEMDGSDTAERAPVSATSIASPQLGVWTHLAGVYDHAAGTVSLYVNGQLAARTGFRSTWYASGPTALGRARYGGQAEDFWPGDLDELQLLPWAASEFEVRQRMAGPALGSTAKWALDEGAGPTATDRDSGHVLALQGGTSWAPDRTGKSSLRFDGRDGHAHAGGPVAARSPEGAFDSFTASAWVKLDDPTDWAWAVSQDGVRDSGFVLGYSHYPRGWGFGMSAVDADGSGGDGYVIAPAAPQLGVWTHLTGVYDHAAGTLTLYVNGRQAASKPHRSTWYAGGALQVGRAKNDGWHTDFWPGQVDDVRIVPGALAAGEVRALAQAPERIDQGGKWALDDSTADATGHGHTLALWPGASWASGRKEGSGGLRFDGTSGHAYTAGPVIGTDASFTASAWVKLDALDRHQTVISQDGANGSGFRLHYDKDARAWAFTVAGDTATGGTVPDGAVLATTTPRLGEWTHVAGVHNAVDDQLQIFVNGRLQRTAPHVGGVRSDRGLVVGRAQGAAGSIDHLSGTVDDVEVSAAAAKPTQVFGLSGLGVPVAYNNSPKPVADLATAESVVTVIGLTPDMASTLEVSVKLKHTYLGDLVLRLISPDGTEYLLEDLTGTGDVDDFDKRYPFNASGEMVNGDWKLRVEDKVLGDTGSITSWGLSAPVSDAPAHSAPWRRINGAGFTVGGNTTTERSVTVSDIPGKAPTNLNVTIDKTYSSAADTKLSLISPDGKEHVLHDPAAPAPPASANPCGPAVDPYGLKSHYVVNVMSAPANGVWKLRFKHTSATGAPTVTAWQLWSPINFVASTAAPNTKFANATDTPIENWQTTSSAYACGLPGTAANDVRVAVDVRHPDRGDLELELVAPDGAATYLLEDFADDDTGDNVLKTYTVAGSAQLPIGHWTLRITDNRNDWVAHLNEWSVQVLPSAQSTLPAGWKAENTADVPITDDGWTESPVTVTGLTGMAPAVWRVDVAIRHTHRGDLALYLEAPDGTGYLLEDLTTTEDADDHAKTYHANAHGEIANGVWKLRVRDAVWGDTGFIDSWSLSSPSFGGANTDVRVPVADLQTAESPLTVTGVTGAVPNGVHVRAGITHAKPEQLVVTLVAPDGTTTFPLHDRKPVLPKAFRLDASAVAFAGTWKLRVQDAVTGEAGSIDSWGLVLAPAVAWPDQRGSAFKVDGTATGATATGSKRVTGIPGNAPLDLRLTLDTSYYWVSELKVALVAPDGTSYTVHDRGATLARTFTVDASAEVANGVWKLSVQRNSSSGTVDITGWSLWSSVNQQATAPGPRTKFANGDDKAVVDDGWSSTSGYTEVSGIVGAAANDVRVAVDVKHPNRGDLKLQLRSPGSAATYLLEDVPDQDTGDDVFATYTVPGVAQIANGSWELIVTDTRTGNTGTIDGWSLQVLPSPQVVLPADWRVENGTDTPIADYATVESPITVTGLTGMAPKDWRVAVALSHTYRGDLALHLVAPDGTAYPLEDFTGTGDAEALVKIYTVNASGEAANGTWKLRVRDGVWGDTGHVDSWSLAAAPTGTPVPAVAWPKVSGAPFKVDGTTTGATATGSVRVAGIPGNAPSDLRLTLDTSYYWVSELKVALVAPDGTSYAVHDRGSSLARSFTVDASAEVANGVWKLSVQRNSSSGTVDITGWSLWSPVNQVPTAPGPQTKFANGADVALQDDGWTATESYVQVAGVPGTAPANLRVSVDVKHPNRGDLVLHLVAPDGTAYLLEDFVNADTGDNVFKNYVVNGSAEAANGSWRLRVLDGVPGNAGTIDGWSLHLAGLRAVAPGTRFENTADVPVPDNGTAESTVSIAGITGSVPSGLRVGVVVRHAQQGDLKLDLVAPDGTVYPLEDLTGAGDADDVVEDYGVNASAEPANGTWRLRVADTALGDVGVIDSWSLTFPAPTKYHNPGDVAIADNGSPATSVIAVEGRTGNAPTTLRVVVNVKHPNRGDLTLDLVAPDGTAYPLEDVPDGDTGDDVRQTYWVDASAEPADGAWALRVRDVVTGHSGGLIDAWSLQFGAE
ncbi:proprotein convertase P-domain-containing protein [Saccharothrix luteola]|uniref:proprotein convertase P-domain-containing protein n=1 Tax=Saccharothrix luteola TaxID=2893018 RepID=UPI001E300E0D|nr:proprotein convertase P-domain-containing protein [Saccharothrix luteola]MCC8243113.1 proprotein convertase P-domain-containing protein [Saccharothrix luteola]